MGVVMLVPIVDQYKQCSVPLTLSPVRPIFRLHNLLVIQIAGAKGLKLCKPV